MSSYPVLCCLSRALSFHSCPALCPLTLSFAISVMSYIISLLSCAICLMSSHPVLCPLSCVLYHFCAVLCYLSDAQLSCPVPSLHGLYHFCPVLHHVLCHFYLALYVHSHVLYHSYSVIYFTVSFKSSTIYAMSFVISFMSSVMSAICATISACFFFSPRFILGIPSTICLVLPFLSW